MDRPGYCFIDPQGVIREKFFEVKYRERLTANNVMVKLFPELGQEVVNTVQAPHLELVVQQSDRTIVPGGLITLIAEVRLPRDVHVYAPETKGNKPIQLVMDSTPEIEFRPAVYPQSKILLMPAIQERVPAFEGAFQIRQDARVNAAFSFSAALRRRARCSPCTGRCITRRATARRASYPPPLPSNGGFTFCRSSGGAFPRRCSASKLGGFEQ